MPQWRNGHFTVCECAKGMYGKMKAFCDIFLVAVAPPSKHERIEERKYPGPRVILFALWNTGINQDLLIIIDCMRSALLIGLCKWRQVIWLNVFLIIFFHISNSIRYFKIDQDSLHRCQIVSASSYAARHLLKSAFLIERSQSQSQSQASMAHSTHLATVNMKRNAFSFERDNWETCLVFCAASPAAASHSLYLVPQRCASLKFFCRHFSKPCRLVFAFTSDHNAHTVTAVHCKWLIMASFRMRNSRADVNKNAPNSRYGWFAQLMQWIL